MRVRCLGVGRGFEDQLSWYGCWREFFEKIPVRMKRVSDHATRTDEGLL